MRLWTLVGFMWVLTCVIYIMAENYISAMHTGYGSFLCFYIDYLLRSVDDKD